MIKNKEKFEEAIKIYNPEFGYKLHTMEALAENKVYSYIAEMGSFVLNGMMFGNGVGDGWYELFVVESIDELNDKSDFTLVGDMWIDLRYGNKVSYNLYDCCPESAFELDLPANWQAVRIFKNKCGDFAIVKFF